MIAHCDPALDLINPPPPPVLLLTSPREHEVHEVHEAKRRFAGARTEAERLDVAISVLEDGLILKWSSVAVVDDVFDSHFTSERAAMKAGDTTVGVLDLAEQPTNLRDDHAAARVGWYLAVKHDDKGVVHDYHLRNSHK